VTFSRFRPRFTLRWLMVAVAIVAILTGLKISWQRQPLYRQMAKDFAAKKFYALEAARLYPRPSKMHHWVNTESGSYEIWPENSGYYALMREKYERLAKNPWLPVASDPPEPQPKLSKTTPMPPSNQ
jgi:hypothetical protein